MALISFGFIPVVAENPYFVLLNSPTPASGGVYNGNTNDYIDKFSNLIDESYTTSIKFSGYYISSEDRTTSFGGSILLVNPTNETKTFRVASTWPRRFWDSEGGILDQFGYDDPTLLSSSLYHANEDFIEDNPIGYYDVYSLSSYRIYKIGNDDPMTPSTYYDIGITSQSQRIITFNASVPIEPAAATVIQNLIEYCEFKIQII